MHQPGRYKVVCDVDVRPDGSQVWIEQEWIPSDQPTHITFHKTLRNMWKPEGLITYDLLLHELQRNGIINDRHQWQLFEIRGGKRTCTYVVLGLYEFLVKVNCLDAMSSTDVLEIFNDAFNTQMKDARLLRGKSQGNPGFYFRLFSLPENERKAKTSQPHQ